MKHKLFYTFFITFGIIFCCGQVSWIQRTFFYLLLKTQFKEVDFRGYNGNWSKISAESIVLKNKKQYLCLKGLDFAWDPFKLFSKRCIFIKKLKVFLEINGQVFSEKKEIYSADFSKIFSQNASRFSFLKYIQFPIPVNVQHLNIAISGYVNGIHLINTRLLLKNLLPNTSSVCNYTTLIQTDNNPYFSHLQLQGNAQILMNKNNKIQKIKIEGTALAKNHQKKYPKCTYTCFLMGSEHAKSETLKCEVHCGQANDFFIEGETFKTAVHALNLHWQGILDHTFIHIFYPHPIPNLSILLDGTCNLNHKTNRWDTRALLSIWGKHFDAIDPSLGNLPNLNFKTEVQASFDTKEVQLQNYKVSLKEKGSKKLFFSVHSDQFLTYNFKKGLQKPSDKNLQLLGIHIYEIPLAFINPYLQKFNWNVEGQLQSGDFILAYTDEGQWQFLSFQPFRAVIKKLAYQKLPVILDTDFRINGKLESNSEATKFDYAANIMGMNDGFNPFLSLKSQGGIIRNDKELNDIAMNGTMKFNQALAREKVDLTAFDLQLKPDLIATTSYDFKKEKQQWTIDQFKILLQSSSIENTWLHLNLNQPVHFKFPNWLESFTASEGNVFTFQCEQCPLDLIRYRDSQLNGKLSMITQLEYEKNVLNLRQQKPIQIDHLQIERGGQKMLDLEHVSLNLHCALDNKGSISFDVNDLMVKGKDSEMPLLKGEALICFKKDKIERTKGQIIINLDEWFLQPFALKFPGVIGDLSTHWNWNNKERLANAQCKISTLRDETFNFQGSYQSEKEEHHCIKSNIELRTANQVSDVHIEGSLRNDVFDGKLTSNRFSFDSIMKIREYFNSMNILKSDLNDSQKLTTSEIVSAGTVKVTKPKPLKAPWCPYTGGMDINCKSICLDGETEIIKDLTSRMEVTHQAVFFKKGRGVFLEGDAQFNFKYQFPTWFDMLLEVQNLRLISLWNSLKFFDYGLNKYGHLVGNCNLDIIWAGDYNSLFDSQGKIHLKAWDGSFKPLSNSSIAAQTVSGFASTIGMLLASSVSEMSALGFINSYIKSIPFSLVQIDLERKDTTKVGLKAALLNSDIALHLNGFIATKAVETWKQQPFNMQLQLDAKEGPFFNYFEFDTSRKTKEGYYLGPNCEINGTLGKPNYMNLLQLLRQKPKVPEKNSPQRPIQQLLQQFLFVYNL